MCIKHDGIIANSIDQTCPQAEEIIDDLKKMVNVNDIIETSTPLAGPLRYYLIKSGINENQFFWYNKNKSLSTLKGFNRIFIITRNERNSIDSFGFDKNFSNWGYNHPIPWKKYGNVTVYVVNKI